MSRTPLSGVAAMAAVVVASNILVQHLLGQWLTWGALTYPLAFLVTDVTNRLHGPAAARRVVWRASPPASPARCWARRSRATRARWSPGASRSARGLRS